MSIDSKAYVIGLTAPFGAGCSTAAEILQDSGFTVAQLSDALKAEWRRERNAEPTREGLQALGNKMREDSGNSGRLAELAVNALEAVPQVTSKIVLDGIRNTGEVEYLRNRFGYRFYLFAVECPSHQRWDRLKRRYERDGRSRADFLADDERDRNQEYKYGQQVQLCVDLADVFVTNDDDVTRHAFTERLTEYVGVVTGAEKRCPAPMEILMNLAYSASHASRCPKRQVGAVLVAAGPAEMGEIIGQGFNENPLPTHPCVEEPDYGADPAIKVAGKCYRDIVRREAFDDLVRGTRRCPQCGEAIIDPGDGQPLWRCVSCQADLEKYFWPERALSLCTAIHAEAAAITTAGRRAKGATLYTTTFPCFQCAEKIAQAGVRMVVFTEPYPDIRAAHRLQLAKIGVIRFEGVRSRKFDEIFSPTRRASA